MATLTASASAGATSMSVTSVSGWPPNPQLELVVGNEVVGVVGPTTIASPLTVTALAVAHKTGELVALRDIRDPVKGARGDLVADVDMSTPAAATITNRQLRV